MVEKKPSRAVDGLTARVPLQRGPLDPTSHVHSSLSCQVYIILMFSHYYINNSPLISTLRAMTVLKGGRGGT